jgi:hypothetical protein
MLTEKLFWACVVFFVIDLTFVGTTTYFVVRLVKKLLKERDIMDRIIELLGNINKKDNRNFIEKGV